MMILTVDCDIARFVRRFCQKTSPMKSLAAKGSLTGTQKSRGQVEVHVAAGCLGFLTEYHRCIRLDSVAIFHSDLGVDILLQEYH